MQLRLCVFLIMLSSFWLKRDIDCSVLGTPTKHIFKKRANRLDTSFRRLPEQKNYICIIDMSV